MDTSAGGKKKGGAGSKSKKLSTRVDLTPMVDLGFLLITFFMFTTTMAQPKTMEINMPFKDEQLDKETTKVKSSAAMTILLSKNHRIYYYEGIGDDPENPPQLEVTYFKDEKGIRKVIQDKIKEVNDMKASGQLTATDNATFLIKPAANSTYEDMVAILDEMNINAAKVYAIVDITPQDLEFIQQTESANQE